MITVKPLKKDNPIQRDFIQISCRTALSRHSRRLSSIRGGGFCVGFRTILCSRRIAAHENSIFWVAWLSGTGYSTCRSWYSTAFLVTRSILQTSTNPSWMDWSVADNGLILMRITQPIVPCVPSMRICMSRLISLYVWEYPTSRAMVGHILSNGSQSVASGSFVLLKLLCQTIL